MKKIVLLLTFLLLTVHCFSQGTIDKNTLFNGSVTFKGKTIASNDSIRFTDSGDTLTIGIRNGYLYITCYTCDSTHIYPAISGSGGTNIYNSDGTFTDTRYVDGDGHYFQWDNFSDFLIGPSNGIGTVQIQASTIFTLTGGGAFLLIGSGGKSIDLSGVNHAIKFSSPDSIIVSHDNSAHNHWTIPTKDGSAGKILYTNGFGTGGWKSVVDSVKASNDSLYYYKAGVKTFFYKVSTSGGSGLSVTGSDAGATVQQQVFNHGILTDTINFTVGGLSSNPGSMNWLSNAGDNLLHVDETGGNQTWTIGDQANTKPAIIGNETTIQLLNANVVINTGTFSTQNQIINGKINTYNGDDVDANASNGVPSIVGHGTYMNLTTDQDLATYTGAGIFEIGTTLTVNAISGATISMQVAYTDENTDPQTFIIPALSGTMTTTGNKYFSVFQIRSAPGFPITVSSILTVAGVSIDYNASATIKRLSQ